MRNNWIIESPVKGVLKVWPILITIWQRMAAMHTGWKSKGWVAQIFPKSRGVEAFRTKLPGGFLFWVELKVRICLWGVLCYAPFPQIHRVHQCCKGFKNTKHIFRHLLFHSLIIQLNMIRKTWSISAPTDSTKNLNATLTSLGSSHVSRLGTIKVC